MVTVREIKEMLSLSPQKGSGDRDGDAVADIATRVEEARAGTVFVCVRTALWNGHHLADAAYARGCRVFVAARGLALPADAAVLLAENTDFALAHLAALVYGQPKDLRVVGVTGSRGKTSTVLMLHHLLAGVGERVATMTTNGVAFGAVRRAADWLAPDAVAVRRFLCEAADHGCTVAIVEFTDYMLKQRTAHAIDFNVAVLTKITSPPKHAGYASDKAYREVLARLLENKVQCAVLPFAERQMAVGIPTFTVGDTEGDLIEELHITVKGERIRQQATLALLGSRLSVTLSVAGRYMLRNAATAITAARALGAPLEQLLPLITSAKPMGRLQCLGSCNGGLVFADSAYTGEALEEALKALRPLVKGRLAVLVGSVGGRAEWRRAELGRAADACADAIYLTADDPDTEDVAAICADMLAVIPTHRAVVTVHDREEAICLALAQMQQGDVLLLAGKGHLKTQLVSGRYLPFSERRIVKQFLKERAQKGQKS